MWSIVRGSSINGSASIHQSFQMYITLEQFCCSLYICELTGVENYLQWEKKDSGASRGVPLDSLQ